MNISCGSFIIAHEDPIVSISSLSTGAARVGATATTTTKP